LAIARSSDSGFEAKGISKPESEITIKPDAMNFRLLVICRENIRIDGVAGFTESLVPSVMRGKFSG
jgi:hypothetical protein